MIVKKEKETLLSYLEDSSNISGGHADEIILPENIGELSRVVRDLSGKKIPITLSGGGTGTTGSRIPFGGVVISMEKFNKIVGISLGEMSCVAESGVLVEDLKSFCDKNGLFYTSHPTERTAFLGGTIATNASGARSFKYGSIRRCIERLKMVLSCGEVLDLRRGEYFFKDGACRIRLESGRRIEIPTPTYRIPKVKNSAGYYAFDGSDLIDLFIGHEGTLSVIVEAELKLAKKPSDILSCFVFFSDVRDAWNFSAHARSVKDALSIEYFDQNALDILRSDCPDMPKGARGAIFFEQEITKGRDHDPAALLMKLIASHNASVDDTWVAMNDKDAQKFSGFRHAIPEHINNIIRGRGYQKISTDIAVPENKFIEMMEFYTHTLIKEGLAHVIFGHIGECHVHVNILPKTDGEIVLAKEIAMSFIKKGIISGGTVSAEHGIGKLKHAYLEEMYGPSGIAEMANIKKRLDPDCVLGLDNIFPRRLLEHDV